LKKKKNNNDLIGKGINWLVIALAIVLVSTLTFYYLDKKFNHNRDNLKYGKQAYSYLENYEVHGIDISKHNGELDWKYITKHEINGWPLSFVFIRASVAMADGNLEEDRLFRDNWRKSRENAITRGAYHFYSPKVDINEQIRIFKRIVKLRSGDLPPVLDVENYDRGNIYITKKNLPDILKWLKTVHNHFGVAPIIYTSKKLYQDYFKNNAKFAKYHFWLANYETEKMNGIESSEFLFWQHNEEGKIDGHICDFDLNVFNGSEKDLEKMCLK
jgi:lysozyme